jgi:RecB family exonuclease
MSQLGFDFGTAEPRKLAKITPAKLSAFRGCPRRYQLTYLEKLSNLPAGASARRTGPWAHSTLGAVVHNALRAFFLLAPEKRTAARAMSLVNEHWRDAGFADAKQAALYRERARGWVADYVEQHDVSATPAGLEQWISARVTWSGKSIGGTSSEASSMIIEGRADRIDRRADELVIVDYKTGRSVPDDQDAHESQALALYAIGAEKNFRTPCRRVELHHLPSGTVAVAEHTQRSLAEHLDQAQETADALQKAIDTVSAPPIQSEAAPTVPLAVPLAVPPENSALEIAGRQKALSEKENLDSVFPVHPGNWCAWCDVRPSCPQGQQAAPPARSWDLLAP